MNLITDPKQIAKEARLRYITDRSTKGYSRIITGDKTTFIDPSGKPVTEQILIDRLEKVYIPPAWKNVWISPDEKGHIQAVGYDEKGRKQYVYHTDWLAMCQEHKFNKVLFFGENLPRIRRRVKQDMELRGLPKEKVVATVVWLLQNTFIRIGNKEYAKTNQSYGLTTLRMKHVDLHKDSVTFSFKGKSGVMHEVDIEDPRVVKTIRKCVELPGYELFQYVSEDKQRKRIDSGDVNEYLHEITGEEFTAKDFRTWGGTMVAALTLDTLGIFDTPKAMQKNIRTAVKTVSEHLRNTATVCKKYYIHPTVISSYENQELVDHFATTDTRKHGLTTSETALITLLEKHV